MKHKAFLLFATMVLVLACVGCGQQTQKESANQGLAAPLPDNGQDTGNNESQPGTDGDPAYGNNEAPPNAGKNPSNADELFEISNLSGTVYEFTETGCTVSPTKEGGEGEAIQDAPGYEDTFVSVVYDSDCTFWIAHVDIKTATVTYESATAEDVKKQTSLILCGEYGENDVLHASRVFIHRIEGM